MPTRPSARASVLACERASPASGVGGCHAGAPSLSPPQRPHLLVAVGVAVRCGAMTTSVHPVRRDTRATQSAAPQSAASGSAEPMSPPPRHRALRRAHARGTGRPARLGGRQDRGRHRPLPGLRGALLGYERKRRGERRQLRPAHPGRQPAAGDSRPVGPGPRALPDPVRRGRDPRAGHHRRPPAHRPGRAPLPAAPARAGEQQRPGRGHPPAPRPGGRRDPRAARGAARPAPAGRIRERWTCRW